MGKSIVVIPAHNEEKTIAGIVTEAKKYCEVFVIDDYSTDKTPELARISGAKVLKNEINVGYTASLNLGVMEAAKTAENIILMDADGQHDPSQLAEITTLLDNGEDFVLGIRHRKARLAEKLFGIFAIWKIGVTDPLCGFRGFKTKVYRDVGFYDSIGSIGTQFVFAARRKGYKIKEIDVRINPRIDNPRFFGGNTLKSEMMILRAFIKTFAYHVFGVRLVNPKWK